MLVKEFWFDKRIVFVTAMLILYTLTAAFTPYTSWTWTAAGSGIILFFFIEYLVHRFALHGIFSKIMPKAYREHDIHHKDPKNIRYMLTPNTYNVPYHLGLGIAFATLFQNIHLASSIMVGFGAYQLFYEWMHYVSHRPITPKTPWGKWMKQFHMLHHHKNAEGYYGVTHPALDIAFGTTSMPHQIHQLNQKNESAR